MKPFSSFFLFLLLVSVSLPSVGQHQKHKHHPHHSKPVEADALLADNEEQPIVVFYGNHAEPNSTEDAVIIEHTAFTISYVEKYKCPEWVSYMLTKPEQQITIKRYSGNFKVDPNVSTCATHADYTNSGYDRGHIFPAANAWTSEIMLESFFTTNITPQLHPFNAGVWLRMEEKEREWAILYDTLYVVSGAVLRDGLNTIGKNKDVAVPEYFFKVMLVNTVKEQKAIAFYVSGDIGYEKPKGYAISVDSLQKLTGFDFCIGLDAATQQKVEQELDLDKWKW
jgi:endonuclease G